MSRRTTEHQLTTVFDSDELISTTVTSTDVTLTTQQTYQQERYLVTQFMNDFPLSVTLSTTCKLQVRKRHGSVSANK